MKHKKDHHALLEQHEIFTLLPNETRAEILTRASIEEYPSGALLFQQGDVQPFCLLILSGEVHIHLIDSSGKEVLMASMGAGDLLGEMALLDNGPRSASATTMSKCALLKIRNNEFQEALNSSPELLRGIIHVLCGRLRKTDEQLMMIALQDLPTRLANYLLNRAAQHGTQSGETISIPLGLKQSDLADLLATSRESINKLLNAWQATGLIKLLPAQTIELQNVKQLHMIAGLIDK